MSSTHRDRRSPAPRLRPLPALIRRSLIASAGTLLAQGALLDAASAAPQGGNVVAGQGQISAPDAATTLVHQQSHSMIVNWQSFDVAKPETVQFNQPSSSAAVLNRVLNQSASQIHGAVRANGQVFILNGSGVVFGKDARVDVGGLVVSSLDITNSDFMQGRHSFKAADGQTPGAIVNRGLIQAARGGSVTLVGGQVANEGVIVADAGHVNLAAGRTATLDFDGDGLLRFEVDGAVLENATGADAAVSNSGEIRAEGGQVLLSARAARQVFDRAVNNSGLIRAGAIHKAGGKVTLTGFGAGVKNTGTVDASGTSGGEVRMVSDAAVEQHGTVRADGSKGNGGLVHLASAGSTRVGGDSVTSARSATGVGGVVRVLGNEVGLYNNAMVDVSGASGGGEVLVGGDYQGANPQVRNASRTVVTGGTRVNADATGHGDGGKVILWSDGVTAFGGSISARGGATGGDGGFVEVSGKQSLIFRGDVVTTAAHGNTGVLFLDPDTINIVAGAADTGADDAQLADQTIDAGDGAGTFTISAGKVVEQLDGTNVSMAANNDINVQALIDASGNAGVGTLTLTAADIVLSSGITLKDSTLTLAGNVRVAEGADVTLSTGAGAGNIAITGNVDGTAGGGAEALGFAAGTGTVTVTGQTGSAAPLALTLGGSGGTNFQNTVAATTIQNNDTAGTLDFDNTVSAATFNAIAGTTTHLDNSLTVTSAGTVAGVLQGTGALVKQGAGTLTLSGANTYTGATTIQAGTLTASNAAALGDAGGGTTVAAGATLNIDDVDIGTEAIALAGSLDGTGAAARSGGVVTLSAGSDFGGAGTLTLTGQVTGTGPLVKNDAGTLVLFNAGTANNYTGATTINAGTLSLGAANQISDASALTVGGGAIFDLAGNAETVGSLAGAGNTTLGAGTLTAGGNGTTSTYSGVLSGAGGLTKQGAGTLTLSGANTYAGATTIQAGTLVASHATALGTTAAGTTVGAGATLDINNVAIGAEAIALSGILKGTGAASLAGGVTLDNAAAVFNTAAGGDALTVSGAVADGAANALSKTGAGTLTLSGANTYTGLTSIQAGTLTVSSAAALGTPASGTAVAAGATLAIANVAIGAEALTLAGTLRGTGASASLAGSVTLNTGNAMATAAGGDVLTLSGVVQNGSASAVTFGGPGTLVLSGVNTYSGQTTINGGTLTVQGGQAIADAGTVQVNAGGIFDVDAAETIAALNSAAGGTTNLDATLTVGAGTVAGVVQGAGGLTKNTAGTLTLSATNTYTGQTTIDGGILRVQGGQAIADTGVIQLNAGGVFDVDAAETIATLNSAAGGTTNLDGTLTVGSGTAAGVLQGIGGLTKNTGGTLTLSAINTYAGQTTITGGTLTVQGGQAIADAGTVQVNAGGIFDVDTAEAIAVLNSAAGGTTNLDATLTVGAGTAAGVVQGAGGLTKNTAGTLTLSGANSYAGATAVQAGTLVASHATALGTTGAGTTVATGATLDINNVAVGAEAVTVSGTLKGTGAASLAGGVTLQDAAAVFNTAAGGDALTVSGAVADGAANALSKTGAGTLTLSGANTYTGLTSIQTGTLTASSVAALGATAGGTAVAAGATLDINNVNIGAEALTLAGTLRGTGAASLAGAVTLNTGNAITTAAGGNVLTLSGVVQDGTANALSFGGPGTLVLSGANTYSGQTTIDGGTLRVLGGQAIVDAGVVQVNAGGTFDVDAAETIGTLNSAAGGTTNLDATLTVGAGAVAGVVQGPGGLTKNTAGTLTLSAANTYAGATAIQAGVLVASHATALGATGGNTIVAAGAALDINNVAIGAEAVALSGILKGTGAASLAGGVTLQNAAATFNTAAGVDALTVSGVVANGAANALSKTGAGTLTFTAANTYTGLTSIQAGTLTASNAAALGTTAGATTVAAGATLNINNVNIGSEAITLAGGLDGSGAGAQAGGVITLVPGGDFGGAGTLTVTGRITGAGALVKNDAGTLVLANAGAPNNYTGASTINAGTLRLGAANQITDSSALTVGGGAIFNLNGNAETVGSLAGSGAVMLGAATLTAGGNGSDTTHAGVISGTGGLIKLGGGTLTLAGANLYAGATTVNAGTLSVTSNTALGGTAVGTTVNGATLDINGLTLGAGQFAEPLIFNGGTLTGTGAVLGAGAAGLLTLGPAGATLAGTFSLGANFALAAGGPLRITAPITANNLAFSVAGAATNLGASIGDASAIAFGPLNVTGASTLTTDALTLNGAVTGGADLTILRASASTADTTMGGTDPLLSASNLARFSAAYTGVLNIGGTRDTPPSAAQLLNDIEITNALTTGGDVFVVGAGDITFTGAGRINSPGNTVSLVALGSAAVPESGNIRDDNSLPTGAAPNFVTAGTLELLAANQIGSESNAEGGTLNFQAAIVSAAQVAEGDAQVDNANRSAGDSDSVLAVQEVYALAAASGAALGGLFNDAFLGIGEVASLSVTTISTPKQAKGELGFIDEGVFLLPSAFTSPERALLMPLLGDADFPADQRPTDPDDEDAWLAFFEEVVRPYIAARHPLPENASPEERARVEAQITAEMQVVVSYYDAVRERERVQLARDEAAREPQPATPADPQQQPPDAAPLQQGRLPALPLELGYLGQPWSHGGIGVELFGPRAGGTFWPVSVSPTL